jgi:hypothetical protein
MKRLVILAATLAACSSSAHAEIKVADQNGFNVVQKATVNATPEVIWKRLLSPKDWWNEAHSWSGTSAGFTLDAQANGCFCELFQEKQKDGKLKTVGSVEHMRVIFALPGKVLRMQGALGPLQAEAVTGTLTVAIEPVKDDASNSILSFSYVVGGYMRYKVSDIAPAMDKVIGEQFAGLIKPFQRILPKNLHPSPNLSRKAKLNQDDDIASQATTNGYRDDGNRLVRAGRYTEPWP